MKTLSQTLSVFALVFLMNAVANAQVSPQFNSIPASFNINSNNPVYATNIHYDDIDTAYQAFHIFLPDTIESYPLVIYIHGGGFRGGSKDNIFGDVNLQLAAKFFLENDIAFATTGYRLLPPETATYVDSIGVIKCLGDSKRALQFIRYYSDELFIDPSKIGLRGSSAGAGTCLWLATRPDMSDPNSPDPVLQQSTRVCGVYAKGSQSTYDLYKWETQVYNDFDGMGTNYTVDSMVQLLGFDRYSDFYGGVDSNYHILYEPALIQYRQDVDMLYHMSSDDPALYIHSTSLATHPEQDIMHHSLHGVELFNAATNASISEVIAIIPAQGIDNSQGESGDEFLVRTLGSCSLALSVNEQTELKELRVYPNPVENELHIEGLIGNETLSMMTLSGNVVYEGTSNNRLDVSHLGSGMYLLIVQTSNSREVVKFLKN
jgi:para-nitrobenzyl esterase